MKELINAYIDSYEYLTILVDKSVNKDDMFFTLYDNEDNFITTLNTLKSYDDGYKFKYIVENNSLIILHKDYYVKDNYGHNALLQSGSIIREERFDLEFYYDGPLGFEYHKEYTIFRIWSPVCREIYIEIFKDDYKEKFAYTYIDKGLWECRIDKDLEGYGYLIYSRVFDKLECFKDPYAISSCANRKYNYVIDENKLYKMKYNRPKFSGKYTDAIIYEASIRDFTCDLKSENRGTYLGMLENNITKKNLPTGLEYIKSLGITHLQLLPTYDFEAVDDLNKNTLYNWGYNPDQYFVPSGWYSKNPNDAYSRINELKELIDNCNKLGLRVVMDVVFNHVYKWEQFAFTHLVPGYFYRVEMNGSLSNASGCGNVIASEHKMASRFIKDVLKYYAKEFNVSGFRFDLMGLLDIDTLNDAYNELNEIDKDIIVYGEGWNMINPLPEHKRATMFNHQYMPNYAFFNDRFRDIARGSQWNNTKGFALGYEKSIFDIAHIATGSCLDYFKFDKPSQSINYVECHDNYTFYDFARRYTSYTDDEILCYAKLALEMVVLSNGIPFIHAGEECLITKQGIDNSYKSKDRINRFDYKRRDKYHKLVSSLKDMITIKKKYKIFRTDDKNYIDKKVHLLEGLSDNHTCTYLLEDEKCDLIIIIKNDYDIKKYASNNLELIYNGNIVSKKGTSFSFTEPGTYIMIKR